MEGLSSATMRHILPAPLPSAIAGGQVVQMQAPLGLAVPSQASPGASADFLSPVLPWCWGPTICRCSQEALERSPPPDSSQPAESKSGWLHFLQSSLYNPGRHSTVITSPFACSKPCLKICSWGKTKLRYLPVILLITFALLADPLIQYTCILYGCQASQMKAFLTIFFSLTSHSP